MVWIDYNVPAWYTFDIKQSNKNSQMNKKILVAAPTSIYKDYIFLDWYLHISNLTYPNYDILIVDNSHDKTYHQELANYGVNIKYVEPTGKTSAEYITGSQNIIRDYFLAGEYSHLMSIEVDIFPPKSVIEKLLSARKKIISVPYFIGFGETSNLLIYYSEKIYSKLKVYQLDLYNNFKKYNGQIHKAYSNGIGCTLFERNVIEKIPFRIKRNSKLHSDTYLYQDVYEAGIDNFIDTSMITIHKNSNWALNLDFKQK